MRNMKLIMMTVCVALVATGCFSFGPTTANIDCDSAWVIGEDWDLGRDNTGTGIEIITSIVTDNQGFTLLNETLVQGPVGTTVDVRRYLEYTVEPHQNPITIQMVTLAGPGFPIDDVHFTFTGDCDNIPFFGFGDDRIAPDVSTSLNVFIREAGLMIYSQTYGNLIVPFDLVEIATPGQNTLVASGDGIEVYVLSDGLIQIMEAPGADGKREIFILDMDANRTILRFRRGHFNINTLSTHIYLQSDGWDNYPMDF